MKKINEFLVAPKDLQKKLDLVNKSAVEDLNIHDNISILFKIRPLLKRFYRAYIDSQIHNYYNERIPNNQSQHLKFFIKLDGLGNSEQITQASKLINHHSDDRIWRIERFECFNYLLFLERADNFKEYQKIDNPRVYIYVPIENIFTVSAVYKKFLRYVKKELGGKFSVEYLNFEKPADPKECESIKPFRNVLNKNKQFGKMTHHGVPEEKNGLRTINFYDVKRKEFITKKNSYKLLGKGKFIRLSFDTRKYSSFKELKKELFILRAFYEPERQLWLALAHKEWVETGVYRPFKYLSFSGVYVLDRMIQGGSYTIPFIYYLGGKKVSELVSNFSGPSNVLFSHLTNKISRKSMQTTPLPLIFKRNSPNTSFKEAFSNLDKRFLK